MKTLLHLCRSALIATAALLACGASAQGINSTWISDGTGNFNNGNWSNALLWNPQSVPNNSGGTVYNVTIPYYPGHEQFNGPKLDLDVTIQDLTLVNRVFLDNQGQGGTNLTVTGTTASTTSAGHDNEYAAIFNAGGTMLLGTLSNYDAGTHTFNGLFVFPFDNSTIGFRGADIFRNNGTIFLGGPNARFIDQDTNQDALRNIAQNDGGLEFGSGINFTTAGDFLNNGSLTAVADAGTTTIVTISGSLTNYDAATHTLSGGFFSAQDRDGGSTATLRFPGADIQHLNYSTISLQGPGASIQDLAGQNALRNLSGITGATLRSAGTLTITPSGGTFTNDGGTHEIDAGADITIAGDQSMTNGARLSISAPTSSSDTHLLITGHSDIQNGSVDMGGQPGVNTQYHTALTVQNGIDFRGAALTGTGTTFADVAFLNGSVFSPGHSAGQLTIQGALNFDSTAELNFEIGGTTAGEQYDQLVHEGSNPCILGGTLNVSLINGFASSIQNSDSFDIITSDAFLAGAFQNVASGDRLATTDGAGTFVVTYADQKTVTLSGFVPALTLVSAVARETHAARGSFDLPLAVTGGPTIESRGLGTHHLVFTFSNNLTDGDVMITAPSGGSISGSPTVSGKTIAVTLTGITNAQKVTITLHNVTDQFAQVLPDTSFDIGFLLGDASGDGYVDSGDATITRNRSGEATDATNFRTDFNLDGGINSADATIVRARSGSTIFPPTASPR